METIQKVLYTPGPWSWVSHDGDYYLEDSHGKAVHSDGSAGGEYAPDIDVHGPDARLIAAAPDHALFAAAVCIGFARWEAFLGDQNEGEVCCDGLRHSTEFDEFGVPLLTEGLRAVLNRAVHKGKL